MIRTRDLLYTDLIDVEIDADPRQYPEFEDAYVSEAFIKQGQKIRALTDRELDFVNDNYAMYIQQDAINNLL